MIKVPVIGYNVRACSEQVFDLDALAVKRIFRPMITVNAMHVCLNMECTTAVEAMQEAARVRDLLQSGAGNVVVAV